MQQIIITRTPLMLFALIASSLLSAFYPVHALELEPRAYSNAPVGLNFLAAGYQLFQRCTDIRYFTANH
jgi:hypothetical protein